MIITPNREFFNFIYNRLKNVYNEDPNTDYMLSLRERIDELFPESGEKTVTDDEIIEEATKYGKCMAFGQSIAFSGFFSGAKWLRDRLTKK